MAMTDLQKELWKDYVGRQLQKAKINMSDVNNIIEWIMEHRSELCDDAAMQTFVDAEKAVEAQNAMDKAKALLVAAGKTVTD